MVEYTSFQKGDAEEVFNVAMASWKHTYKDIFSTEEIESFVSKNYSISGLIELLPLIEAKEMFFFVAVDGGKVVGFNNVADRGQGMRILRIYLLPEYIGKGIGKKLLELGEQFVKEKGGKSYFCFVNERNTSSIHFYEKNGFIHKPERDKQGEWFMEKEL
jgi:diamine N-acetyltransferase